MLKTGALQINVFEALSTSGGVGTKSALRGKASSKMWLVGGAVSPYPPDRDLQEICNKFTADSNNEKIKKLCACGCV